MSTPFLSQISLFSFGFPPRRWAQCDGQLLPIAQNQALFSLLGTTFGGNGTTNFALPDMRSRTPVGFGNGPGLPPVSQGERSGVESVTLISTQMPAHNHTIAASSAAPAVGSPSGATWATGGSASFAGTANAAMSPSAIANAGGNQPHENRAPSLVLNFCIALQGIFPSRN